jgi:hypothetical protein
MAALVVHPIPPFSLEVYILRLASERSREMTGRPVSLAVWADAPARNTKARLRRGIVLPPALNPSCCLRLEIGVSGWCSVDCMERKGA